MFIKKTACYFVLLTISIASLQGADDTATLLVNIPNLNKVAQSIDQFVQTLTKSYSMAPLVTIGTLTTCFSAYSLVVKYPSKPKAERTRRDWMIPACGLTGGLALIALSARLTQ